MMNYIMELAADGVLVAGDPEHPQERRIAHRRDAVGIHAIDAVGRGIEHKAEIGLLAAQAGFGNFAFGDVLRDADQLRPRAVRALHQRHVDVDPDFRSVRPQVALFDGERDAVGDELPPERGVGVPIIGMGDVGHAQRQKLFRGAARRSRKTAG